VDALVALGFLQRKSDQYSNTSETDLFLDKRKPSYIGGVLEMANHRLFGFWNHLTHALRTGHPQNESKPEVGPTFEENMEEKRLSDRVTLVGGNFFTGPLPNADVVLMGHILHDWALEEKKMLLRKAYEAVPEGGAVVIYDAMIDDDSCRYPLDKGTRLPARFRIDEPQ